MHAHTHMKHKHRHRPRQWKQQHQQATVKKQQHKLIHMHRDTASTRIHSHERAHTHRKLKHTEVDLRVHASVCVSVCLSACQRHWHSSGNARRNQSEVGHNQQFSYKTKSVCIFIQLENDIIQLNLQKREKQTRIKSPYFRNRPCSLQKCSLNIADNGFLAFEGQNFLDCFSWTWMVVVWSSAETQNQRFLLGWNHR